MRFVVIGASAAGITAVQKLRECSPDAEILLISKDREVYSRCILYHYLDGSRTLEEMNFAGLDFDAKLGIRWMKGTEVTSVDIQNKTVHTDRERDIPYDRLCIASGSRTNFPPIPGLREGNNVFGFRDLEDAKKIKDAVQKAENIFVMGAGLIGIDVIAGLLDYEKRITLSDLGPYMMPLQLDEYAAGVYQKLFAEKGVKQYYGMGAKEFVTDRQGNCHKVILQDGTEIQTDLVINCAGVRANVDFLKGSGIAYDRQGLIIDGYGRTNVPDVFGAGDVTGRSTIWPTAIREGMTAAYAMCGILKQQTDYFAGKASLHFLDVPTVSIGKVNHYDDSYDELIFRSKASYQKIVLKDRIVAGALLQGDLENSGPFAESVRLGTDISQAGEGWMLSILS